MTIPTPVETLDFPVAGKAISPLLNVAVAVVSIVATWLLARRSHAIEDRRRVLDALQSARNFWVPREYRDLDDALYAVTDALVPFRPLRGHGELLKDMTLQAWRETSKTWEEQGGGPGYDNASISNTLRDALADLNAAISLRVRRPRWRQGHGARRELDQLRAAAD